MSDDVNQQAVTRFARETSTAATRSSPDAKPLNQARDAGDDEPPACNAVNEGLSRLDRGEKRHRECQHAHGEEPRSCRDPEVDGALDDATQQGAWFYNMTKWDKARHR